MIKGISPDLSPGQFDGQPNETLSVYSAIARRRHRLTSDFRIRVQSWAQLGGHLSASEGKSLFHRVWQTVDRQFLPHYFLKPPKWRLFVRKFGGARSYPDFCIIGPIKAGSTDISTHILLHPNVLTPLTKEIATADLDELRLHYPRRERKVSLERLHGVALAPYLAPALHSIEYAHCLAQLSPKRKVVITLRHPVRRMYSQWKWEVFLAGHKQLKTLSFLSTFESYVNTALAMFPTTPMYTACGRCSGLHTSIYWKAVQYWIELFNRENILVLDSEDYFRDRNPYMRRIEEFIGLPHANLPRFGNVINENPLRLPPPKPDTVKRLNAFFRPHNEHLWDVIGDVFPW